MKKVVEEISQNYCEDERECPLVDEDTDYSFFMPNGSLYLNIPQCTECMRSNSYGQYGCPRLNKGLPIREAKFSEDMQARIEADLNFWDQPRFRV
jgi:hypothetical protein